MEIVDISRHDEKMMMRMMTMTNVMANVPGPAECAERFSSPGTVPHFQHNAKTAAAQNLLKVCIPSHPLPPAPPGERARGPRGEGWAEAVSEPLGVGGGAAEGGRSPGGSPGDGRAVSAEVGIHSFSTLKRRISSAAYSAFMIMLFLFSHASGFAMLEKSSSARSTGPAMPGRKAVRTLGA